jgi:hypothetical protein
MENFSINKHINYLDWFNPSNYDAIYKLPKIAFFQQIAIRHKWLGDLKDNSNIRTKTVDEIINGDVILTIDADLDVYKYIRPLSYETAIVIASNVLMMVDQNRLTLDILQTKSDLHDVSPLFCSMLQNIGNDKYDKQCFDEAFFGRKTVSYMPTIEVDLEVDTMTLLNQFELFIEQEKKASSQLAVPKEITKKVDDLINKLKAYKVIETYDLMKASEVQKYNLTQKELALFLFDDWTDDNLRKKTIKHIEMIFDWDFYNRVLIGKN